MAGFSDQAEDETSDEARLLWATCGGVRVASVYVPNGRSVGSELYEAKLKWLDRLLTHVRKDCDPTEPLAICGDFNVAPDDRDVWDASKLHGGTHISEPERQAVRDLCDWGLVDAFRTPLRRRRPLLVVGLPGRRLPPGPRPAHRPRPGHAALADRASYALIDRFARKGKLPSDHAPLLVDFDI